MLQWFVDDVVDELGSRREVEYAFEIMRSGTSADRQLEVFDETGDLEAGRRSRDRRNGRRRSSGNYASGSWSES